LFDRNYLVKGLALYESLVRHGGKFVLHILCMDDTAFELLLQLNLSNARLIRRVDFEDPRLLEVKPTRTVAEYCWTCTPSLPLYILNQNPEVNLITYVDADLYFFSTPEPIFEEFGNSSVLIVGHRFSPRFLPYEVNGKFNVEWLTFRRNDDGLAVLHWWREKCIEWCFYRLEEDRMGDQKYLDTWPERFNGVHVLQHVGAGVAPWNFSQYRIESRRGAPTIDDVPLIFYHFHGFRCRADGTYIPVAPMYLQDAPLPSAIYDAYQAAIAKAWRHVRKFDRSFSYGFEEVDGFPAAGDLTSRMYWSVPEPVRGAVRRIVPLWVRARFLRALGLRDHRTP
jgi:hypothetical protein